MHHWPCTMENLSDSDLNSPYYLNKYDYFGQCWWLHKWFRCWGQVDVGDFLLMKIFEVTEFRYWWHLLDVGARRLCLKMEDVGDGNGQNRHQYLKGCLQHISPPTSITNIDVAKVGTKFGKNGVAVTLSPELRVVQTHVILFLKSMSERGGSDIERPRIWIKSSSIDLESI